MLDLTSYQKAGYGAIFIETMEMKRAIRSIQIDEPFKTKLWSPIRILLPQQMFLKFVLLRPRPYARQKIVTLSSLRLLLRPV